MYMILIMFFVTVFSTIPVFADLYVDDGFNGFYGINGTYNAIGVIKNSGEHDAIGYVTIQINDTEQIVKSIVTHSIKPGGEIPFKISIPEANPDLHIVDVSVSSIGGLSYVPQVEVIYDETLIVHPDGHITGRIVNSDIKPAKHVQLVAVAHGEDHKALDVVTNAENIAYMMPGEVRNFTMYPDMAIAEHVSYYSCFGLGDLSVIPLNVKRSGEVFPVRYDSGLLLAYPEFNEKNTNLSITIVGGWPLHDSINIEFPKHNDDEIFDLSIDGEPIKFTQSIDEFGSWHVAFNVEPQSSGLLVIDGFDPDAVYDTIPQYARDGATMWASGQITDEEFAPVVTFLIGNHGADVTVPSWVRNNAGWWSAGLITDEEFVAALKYLATSDLL